MKTIAIISSQSFSLVNFRGPLISRLTNESFRVYALAPDYSNEFRRQVIALGATPIDISISNTGMNPLLDFLNMFKLALVLRRLRPNITLSYFVKPVIFGTLAAWLARIPKRLAMIEGLGFIFTNSGEPLPLKRKLLKFLVSFLYRFALGRASGVFFLNRDDITDFVGAGLVDENKVFYLSGIGVDLALWQIAPPITKPVTFLLAARLLREKGILEYSQAARLVKELYPSTRFILLGGIDLNPSALSEAQVQACINKGLIEWPGHVSVKSWLAQASVFVLPSYYREGLPRSIQEAMAMARPVITTDAPGCRDTVVHGMNGLIIPVRDVAKLVEAMLFFVRQPELIAPMGAASRLMAEEKFDVNKINTEILKIIKI